MVSAERHVTLLSGLSAIWGLFGVILLAMGGHGANAGLLTTSGQFLLFHGVAVLALSGRSDFAGWRLPLGCGLLLFGSGLFSGAIAFHVLLQSTRFIILTPLGGGLAIVGWTVLVAGIFFKPKQKA